MKKAFTLFEIILAVTIFALVISSLLMTFRTGMQAYEKSSSRMEVMQEGRYILSRLSQDLRTTYYREESAYNTTLRNYVERFLREREREYDEAFDERRSRVDDEDENPYDYCIEIDLGFKGEDKEEKDSLSFVSRRRVTETKDSKPFGLERVKYFVSEDGLFRSITPVFSPDRNINGEVISSPTPRADKIASRVRTFDLKYGFFYDGEWLETDSWNSEGHIHRNPRYEVDGDDPDYSYYLRLESRKPKDHLPAYVKVRMEIGDKNREKKFYFYDSEIRLYLSQENYLPSLAYENQEKMRSGGGR